MAGKYNDLLVYKTRAQSFFTKKKGKAILVAGHEGQ
jgi:hypothetical protein